MVGLLRLSRWKEHIPFTLPATWLGITMAAQHRPGAVVLDWRIMVVTAANLLVVTCAFMINDVEDAPDDARSPARAARNPVTTGDITRRVGWLASGVMGGLALALYAALGDRVLGVGLLAVALAFLYSWRGVRLKAHPLVDVVSHALVLSALLVLAGYATYDNAPGTVWIVILGAALVSAYGQLYNQVRDYELDRAAGLVNTAAILGRTRTQRLMVVALVLAGVCLVSSVALDLWPVWFVLAAILMLPLLVVIRPRDDMRGTQAFDASGRAQAGFFLIANVLLLVWLVNTLV